MTFHFINLVSWRFFAEKKLHNSILYCDSLTFSLLARLCKKKIKRISGVSRVNSIHGNNSGYLVSDYSPHENRLKLPYWKNLDDVKITDKILDFCKNYKTLVIAISSPKQDKLAMLINDIYPEKEIYCFGAALNTNEKLKFLDKFGFMWLGFLFQSPLRTLNKIFITSDSILKILTDKQLRINFIDVIAKIKNN